MPPYPPWRPPFEPRSPFTKGPVKHVETKNTKKKPDNKFPWVNFKWRLNYTLGAIVFSVIAGFLLVFTACSMAILSNTNLEFAASDFYNPLASLSSEKGGLFLQTAFKKNSSNQEKIIALEILKKAYPGMGDLLLYQEAEINSVTYQEAVIQKSLILLLNNYPQSILTEAAHYRLGQSFLRGNEPEKAKKQFKLLLKTNNLSSPSQWRIGALYYLGQIAPAGSGERKEYWLDYLKKTENGRFIKEVIDGLISTEKLSDVEKTILIKSMANNQLYPDRIRQLAVNLPIGSSWLSLAKSYYFSKQNLACKTIIINDLGYAETNLQAESAIDLLLKTVSSSEEVKVLQALTSRILPYGGDYALFLLAKKDLANAKLYQQKIVSQFPQSDYAPELLWGFIWENIINKNTSTALLQLKQYSNSYPNVRAASKALFWTAKLLEKESNTAEAIAIYNQILTQFPNHYYAFRAWGRLQELTQHQQDPLWQLASGQPQLPLPDFSTFKPSAFSSHQQETLKLLAQANLGETLVFYLNQPNQQPNAYALAWALEQLPETPDGSRLMPLALRQLRDALREKEKEKTPISRSEWQLLYPLKFNLLFNKEGLKNKTDYLLFMSLAREESYFDAQARSSSNAQGLMQLLPSTAADIASRIKLTNYNLNAPQDNIILGSAYLNWLLNYFNQNAMLAVGAYNGGPGSMRNWMKQHQALLENDPDAFVESIPYTESRDYIKKVFASYWSYRRLYAPKEFPAF